MAIVYQQGEGLPIIVDSDTGIIIQSSDRWYDTDIIYYEVIFPEDSEFYVLFIYGEKYRWRDYVNPKGEQKRQEIAYTLCLGLGDFDNVLYKIGNERLARYGYTHESFKAFFEQAMFLLKTKNGERLKFVPDYKVEWVEGRITKERT